MNLKETEELKRFENSLSYLVNKISDQIKKTSALRWQPNLKKEYKSIDLEETLHKLQAFAEEGQKGLVLLSNNYTKWLSETYNLGRCRYYGQLKEEGLQQLAKSLHKYFSKGIELKVHMKEEDKELPSVQGCESEARRIKYETIEKSGLDQHLGTDYRKKIKAKNKLTEKLSTSFVENFGFYASEKPDFSAVLSQCNFHDVNDVYYLTIKRSGYDGYYERNFLLVGIPSKKDLDTISYLKKNGLLVPPSKPKE